MAQVELKKKRRVVQRTINAATAAQAVGPIERGCDIYGLSKGQFSLIELIAHVLDATGPADLVISTWTAAGADMAFTQSLLEDGRVLSARWMVDFSFPSRQPAYCEQLRARFGDAAIIVTANHAKFVVVRNAAWSVCIRTSMNLNLNRRLESYEVSDDTELADFLLEVVQSAFEDGTRIVDAIKSPSRAKNSVNDLGGAVEKKEEQVSYQGKAGITYEA